MKDACHVCKVVKDIYCRRMCKLCYGRERRKEEKSGEVNRRRRHPPHLPSPTKGTGRKPVRARAPKAEAERSAKGDYEKVGRAGMAPAEMEERGLLPAGRTWKGEVPEESSGARWLFP